MAATVYTGRNQDFAYTNSTGGNVRVIIYWLHIQYTSSEWVKLIFGDTTGGTSSNDYVEYTLDVGSSGTLRFGKNVAAYAEGDRALNNMYSTDPFAAPTEIFLANGHVFRIDAQEDADVLAYNFVVIPENG